MLRCAEDGELFRGFAENIQSVGARQAYRYLIGWGAESTSYACIPKQQGFIASIRFCRGLAWDFAFIPNREWLTFYFRKPCLGLAKYTRQEVLRRFPEAEETNAGEFIVRIAAVEDAIRVVSYVEG